MKRFAIVALTLIVAVFTASGAYAAGTAAGTSISNVASVEWHVGAAEFSGVSTTDTIYVDELIDFTLTWQDTSNVGVEPAQLNSQTVYRLTNTGNGSEDFSLATLDTLTPGAPEMFNPAVQSLWLDTDLDGTADSQYNAAFTLAADAAVDIFVLSNIPEQQHDNITDVASGNEGDVQVTATSETTGALVADGTIYPLAGPDRGDGTHVNAVIADSTTTGFGGELSVTGTYEITTAQVAVVKTSTITDPFGGNSPVPGATITYQLQVTHSGSAPAEGVEITDVLPPNTTYVDNSMMLFNARNAAGLALTDLSTDAEGASCDGTTVVIDFGGSIDSSELQDFDNGNDGIQSIRFQVTIN